MTITMDDSHLVSIGQIKEFVKVGGGITFTGKSRDETYRWIEMMLGRFWYFSLRKKEKTIIKQYVMKMTGYSDAQLTRLIKKKRQRRVIRASREHRHTFPVVYGPTTAAALIAELTDIQRFSSPKHFTAFLGLDPRVHQSGASIQGKGYITKRGNKILRTLFYNCASVAIQRPNTFQSFYQKKVSEGKPKLVALIATAHKLAKVAYAVWKTNTPHFFLSPLQKNN